MPFYKDQSDELGDYQLNEIVDKTLGDTGASLYGRPAASNNENCPPLHWSCLSSLRRTRGRLHKGGIR